MKGLVALLFLVVITGCQKQAARQPGDGLADLEFISTSTPKVVSEGNTISSRVKCYAPNLCYRFARFDIRETSARQFDIRAKATYPQGKDVVCLQAIYKVDTTISINASTKGQYILRFYQNNTLFKADTVEVN